jgi:hypothetical protein
MLRFKTIAFYTKDTPYEEEAKKLVQSAKKFGISVETASFPNQGEWVKNAALKPTFILGMMEKYLNQEWFLYVDVDARFRQYPSLFDTFVGDLGVHYRRGKELLSGTIFIRNTLEMRAFVSSWISHQRKNPKVWDQKTLQYCVEYSTIKVVDLPAGYTQIFDSMSRHGQPVIEHMQASRRYRKVVEFVEEDSVPHAIGNTRIRRSNDGLYYLTRRNREAEAYLDARYARLENQLKWYPTKDDPVGIQELGRCFEDKGCYIVGKGPSLDNIRKEHFPESWPIVCLNESIHAVEALGLENDVFALQQDAKLRDACYPATGTLLVSIKAANWYAELDRVCIYDPRVYGLRVGELSVGVAIKIAQSLRTKQITLVCFDASVNGHLGYAKAITLRSHEAEWGGNPNRFQGHMVRILKFLGDTPVEWVMPKECVESTSCIPQR